MRFGISEFIQGMGLDLNNQHLARTPERVVKAWVEEFGIGYSWKEYEIEKLLSVDFQENCDEMVVVKDISFISHCSHHLVPFCGTAKIGYIPDGRVVGLSKLARVLDVFASRLQIQENLTQQTADAIQKYLKPKGVGVVLEATHFCMAHRGVKKPGSIMKTSSLLGLMREDDKTRSEFLSL